MGHIGNCTLCDADASASRRPGNIGVPLPEVTLKLIQSKDGRCELHLKGPNVFKGYYRDPEKSKEAFDDEGFLITNDAVKFVHPNDANAGLSFDGRISEIPS